MSEQAAEQQADRHTQVVQTRGGRLAVGVGLVIAAIWIVGPNVPVGPMRSQIDVVWSPAAEIGLVQDWAVFSPNPRDQSLDVRAVIEHEDGSAELWDVPEFDPVLGAYRQYRWHKWQERIRLDAQSESWEPTARWLAERHARDGELPIRITLVRRWIDHEPLTADGTVDSDANEFAFYVWERDA